MEQIKQEASALKEITMFGITVEQSDRVQLTKKEVEFRIWWVLSWIPECETIEREGATEAQTSGGQASIGGSHPLES